jgi:signal peptidase I
VPDLPEKSRASREADDPRPDGGALRPEPRANDSSTAYGLTAPPSGNGAGGHGATPNGALAGTGLGGDAPPTADDLDVTAPGGFAGLDDADPTVQAEIRAADADATATDAKDAEAGDGGEGGEGGADDGGKHGTSARKPRRSPWRSAVEWALVIGGALLVALVVRTFLVQAFWIPSASMEPTLHEGDRVLVNKLSYDLHDVHHGDVIVFERPDEPDDVPHPEDEIRDLIKRVIALPGDVIEGRDGVVYLNDEPLDEPYLAPDTPTTDLPRQEIPEGKVFVMGDNRTNSHDSRRFGPVDESSIVGRAFLRIYPLDDIGGL